MAKVRDEVGKKVREAIEHALRGKLGQHGFREATVRAGHDHDGNPMLFIVAYFDLIPGPLDVAITIGITDVVRDALDEIDEFRFPIINYHFHDDQLIAPRKRKRRACKVWN